MMYEFTITSSDTLPTDKAFDRLTNHFFDRFEGDVLPAITNAQLVFDCGLEADSLASALAIVVAEIEALGIKLQGISVPEMV